MRPRMGLQVLAVGWLLATGASALADEPPKWHPWRLRQWPGRLFIGKNNRENTFERAGWSSEVSCLAHPSSSRRYSGYYVGGGSPCKGTGSSWPREGTWGMDYNGLCSLWRPKIELLWNDKYQGGRGSYKTDGPPVKDVGPYIEKFKEGPVAIPAIVHSKHE